ncbi:MAG: PAS domain-containing protein [Acidobacteria bacterium]|nr:PAS domain-containing protein [Acidobacteriota bacterium]
MGQRAETINTFDVRTKLLVMLAVLSLPLLIIGLLQLHSHQKSLNDQAANIARIEAASAADALESWVETHTALSPRADAVTPAEASELYVRLRRRLPSGAGAAAVAVLDAEGRPVNLQSGEPGAPVLGPEKLSDSVAQQRWSDGVRRVTRVVRVEPSPWSVVVGVLPPEDTPAGRAILILTATWAVTLLASCLLAVWAVGRFTKPLRQLAASASTFGEGNLQERVEVETEDEVGSLAENFNVMAASLQTKFDAVKKQSAFIGEVLDSLPLGVVVLDAKLVVRKVNAAFASMAGRDAAHLTGRGLYEAAAGLAVLSEVVEDVRRTRRAFVNYSLPLELVARGEAGRGEGQKFWDVIIWPVMEQSEGRGDLLVLLSEVSKRVRAEKLATSAFAAEKSRSSELASVINQMDEGVLIVDAAGRYRLNPAAARILGRDPGEFRDGVKALVFDMALRDPGGHVLAPETTPVMRALERGEHVTEEQCKIVRRGGEERVLAVSATPLVGEGGRAEGLVAVFRDITEAVERHEELVAAYDRLREHDRLKSAFVANMSHELRTPLNVIIGLSQLLSRDPALPLAPLQTEAIARMERNARALLDLVNDMLDYSRLEGGRSALHLETVSVEELVNVVAANYLDEAREKKIALSVEVAPEVGLVTTDRHKLTQVVSCLMSNALKFTSEGMVHIRAGAGDEGRWYIEVSDTGIGISSDALTYIFDGFRQVDDRMTRSYNGVGLGLAITRRVVELLEGELTVESKQNEGSCFRITWPREARPRTGTGSLVRQPETLKPRDEVKWRVRAG